MPKEDDVNEKHESLSLIKSCQEELSIEANKQTTSKYYLYGKTIALIYSWMCMGLYTELLGPSLPELQSRASSNYEEIGRALTSRAAGLFAGSLIGGILADKFKQQRDLILSLVLLFCGLCVSGILLCKSLWLLSVVLFVLGFFHGIHNNTGNPSLVDLWQAKSSGPLNLMHAGSAMGASFCILIIKCFVTQRGDDTILLQDTSSLNSSSKSTTLQLEYSYPIISCACLASSLSFFILFCCSSGINAPSSQPTNPPPNRSANTEKNYRILLLVLTFFTYVAIVGGDRVFSKYLFTYATKSELHLDMNTGYTLNTMYWVLFCAARILSCLVLIRAPLNVVFLMEISLCVVCTILMNISPTTQWLFYVSVVLYSICRSPVYPTCLGVINQYVEVTGIVCIIVGMGGAVGGMSSQYLTGYLIQNFGFLSFLYVMAGHECFLFLVSLSLLLVGNCKGKRFLHKREEVLEEQELTT